MSRTPEGRPPSLAWLDALARPDVALDWSLAEWQHAVRLGRRLRLLSRLAEAIDAAGLLERIPAPARRHLRAEQRLSRWRTQAVRWAIERLGVALGGAAYPKVLLKGAAYLGQDLPIARGRLPSDLDILVPREHLDDALRRLEAVGWSAVDLDEHDRRYYIEWGHEVPPMTHAAFTVELDLHHNIVPPVARTTVDAAELLRRLQPSTWPAWQVFHPVDQVLHSAAHLFFDSDARDRVRDLVDLDGLMRHFGASPAFWPQLIDRAGALGLTESLALAGHFTSRWLGTPMPEPAARFVDEQRRSSWRRRGLLALLDRALRPTMPDDRPAVAQDLAATVLLARYHRNRMPMQLLLPHVWHKLTSRSRGAADAVADAPQ